MNLGFPVRSHRDVKGQSPHVVRFEVDIFSTPATVHGDWIGWLEKQKDPDWVAKTDQIHAHPMSHTNRTPENGGGDQPHRYLRYIRRRFRLSRITLKAGLAVIQYRCGGTGKVSAKTSTTIVEERCREQKLVERRPGEENVVHRLPTACLWRIRSLARLGSPSCVDVDTQPTACTLKPAVMLALPTTLTFFERRR